MLREILRKESINDPYEKHTLSGIFSDEKIIKIMHGCDSDLKFLVADLGIVTVNLFDTAKAFSFIQRI